MLLDLKLCLRQVCVDPVVLEVPGALEQFAGLGHRQPAASSQNGVPFSIPLLSSLSQCISLLFPKCSYLPPLACFLPHLPLAYCRLLACFPNLPANTSFDPSSSSSVRLSYSLRKRVTQNQVCVADH
jgi:hypothetical protein